MAPAPKEVAIIGAGGRGQEFAKLITEYGHLGRVVAVAEPRDEYRRQIAEKCTVPAARLFRDWREFVAKPKMCDAVVIATMDRDHVGPAAACLKLGYDLILEKPMATSLEDCRAIEAAQRASKKIVAVCHSMRYIKSLRTMRDMVAAGAIGRVMTMDQLEPVGFFHQAHSFVRGNWGNSERSTFMLLAKSCHDLDYISYVVDKPCLSVMSYGHLSYFTPANAPAGATDRCTDPCPAEPTCPFSAIKQYVQTDRTQWWGDVVSPDHSAEAHMQAIRTGPYGRCVYKCDNDVVDHQVVAMQFADDITVTFTMTAFNRDYTGRQIRVHGTKGMIEVDKTELRMYTFATRDVQTIKFGPEFGSHGGGDARVAREWLTALHTRDDSAIVANAQESLKSHTIVFAAEKSRREGRVVKISEM